VLVVTSEVMSPLLNPDDFDTAILFGDAATAPVVAGPDHGQGARAALHRPILDCRGEDGTALQVPLPGEGRYVHMKGGVILSEAVRAMNEAMRRACAACGIGPKSLRLVVPHQANGRILDAVGRRIGVPVFSNIRHLGNTSSSSIPLALTALLADSQPGRIGLCAFGGGFTSGAALIEVLP
jgi:2-oxoisovalerate dehydrogenase E1 component